MIKRTIMGHKLSARAPFKGINNIPKYVRPPMCIADKADLIPHDCRILDQGPEGECTAASSGGAWMYLQLLKWRLQNPNFTLAQFWGQVSSQRDVSMDFIYPLALQNDGNFGLDAGSYGSTVAKILRDFGCVYDDIWPNTTAGYCTMPDQKSIAAAKDHTVDPVQLMNIDDLRFNLAEGYPAWLGCVVFPSFTDSGTVMASGIIPMPRPNEKMAGGHEMKVIGFNDADSYLDIDNSWGTKVGIAGRFKMPYDYFEKYVSECYSARLPSRIKG